MGLSLRRTLRGQCIHEAFFGAYKPRGFGALPNSEILLNGASQRMLHLHPSAGSIIRINCKMNRAQALKCFVPARKIEWEQWEKWKGAFPRMGRIFLIRKAGYKQLF